jgi:hypothetical protein
MNLSNGDNAFQPVTELQNVNLAIDAMNPLEGPDSWSAMWLAMRSGGSQSMSSLDNLLPHVSVVLQPNLDLYLYGVDAVATFGRKFDVVLELVDVPADPGGLYWGLKQYRSADVSTPSTSRLLSNLDLEMDAVDVMSVFPTFGSVTDVRFEFQGWDLSNPQSMTWKLVALDSP